LINFLVKFTISTVVLLLSSFLLPEISYPYLYQPIVVGFVLAWASYMVELMLLNKGTLWISTLTDLAVSIIIVYFVSLLLPGSSVSVTGATLTAIFLAMAEYLQHIMLIRSIKTGPRS